MSAKHSFWNHGNAVVFESLESLFNPGNYGGVLM